MRPVKLNQAAESCCARDGEVFHQSLRPLSGDWGWKGVLGWKGAVRSGAVAGRLLHARSLPRACPLRWLGGERNATDPVGSRMLRPRTRHQGLLAAGRGLALRQTAALLRARAPCAPLAAVSALQTGFGEERGGEGGGGVGREGENEREGARAVSFSGRGHVKLSPPSAA